MNGLPPLPKYPTAPLSAPVERDASYYRAVVRTVSKQHQDALCTIKRLRQSNIILSVALVALLVAALVGVF